MRMESLVTWIGGKGKYLDRILPLMPKGGKRYIEPFAGGGSLFLNADGFGRYYVNDLCPQLFALYTGVQERCCPVRSALKLINIAWWNIGKVFRAREEELIAPYLEFRDMQNRYGEFVERVDRLMRSVKYAEVFPMRYTEDYSFEMEKRFQYSKMFWRLQKNPPDDESLLKEYVFTAMKMSVYSYFTELYASGKFTGDQENAILMFLLEYSSNGQFTFDRHGVFRPTYGGRGLNRHSLDGKIAMMKSQEFKERMAKTKFFGEDAVTFMQRVRPKEDDFIVLDPPLGKMFKTVGHHTYTEEEFIALKEYLSGVKAPWMMTIPKANFDADDAFYAGKHINGVGPHGEIVVVTSYNPG